MARGSAAGARSRSLRQRQTRLPTQALPEPRVPGSSVAASEHNVPGPSRALSLGPALPFPTRARPPPCWRPPRVLELWGPRRDGAPHHPPKATGRQKRWFWWCLPRRHQAAKAQAGPAQRLCPSPTGDVPELPRVLAHAGQGEACPCQHSACRQCRRGAPALCQELAPSPTEGDFRVWWAPAPREQRAAVAGSSGRQHSKLPGRSQPVASLSPALRQGPWDPILKARKGFGAGRASLGLFSLDNHQH